MIIQCSLSIDIDVSIGIDLVKYVYKVIDLCIKFKTKMHK